VGVLTRRGASSAVSSPAPVVGSATTTRPVASDYNAPRALTASAQVIDVADKALVQYLKDGRKVSSWQADAWAYYDAIGEVKYAFTLLGNIVSRIRLYAAVPSPDGGSPIDPSKVEGIDEATAAKVSKVLARMTSMRGGQGAILRDAAINFSVAGECYLVQTPERLGSGTPESWDIKSVDEVKVTVDGKVGIINRRDVKTPAPVLPNAFVARLWREHPRFSDEPDSSMMGVLDACSELMLLSKTFKATARSRLNAGMLYLPDGLSVSSREPNADADDSDEDDDFERELMDAMTTPITEEDSAAAVVPLLVRGPEELGDKIKQFKFDRSFDPALAERADRLLERILQGIDVPKDVVTGLANVKYSNAVQINESLYKSHIEPMAVLICDAFTTAYLRPALVAAGMTQEDADQYIIWYDPSDIITRPDHAEDANIGYDKYLISAAAWRSAHNFDETDAPDSEEVIKRMMVEKGQLLPDYVQALIEHYNPDLASAMRGEQQASAQSPVPPEVSQALGVPPSQSSTPPVPSAPASPVPPAGA
jgi:hypothetical protein